METSMDKQDRKNTPDKPVADTAAPEYYEQALALSARASEAGSLAEALMWAEQAELIGHTVENRAAMREVTQTYARIMLSSCLKSQELALTTGNVLKQHGELAEIIKATSEHLATAVEPQQAQPRAVALMAQGFSRKYKLKLDEKLAKSQHAVVSKADDLDSLLANLAEIERCATILCGPNPPALSVDRKVAIAKTAISNARFSLVKVFSKQLSDWNMAQFFCKHAYKLLTQNQIESLPQQSGNEEIDDAVKDLPAAYDALKRKSYKESAEHLDSVLKELKNSAAK